MHTLLRRSVSTVVLSIASASLIAFTAPAANAQATRTWVSGVGDDANPCSRTAPCKTWAGAISKTATGGTINALDSGGFGGVTITKSITLDGTGVAASALVSGTDGIRINSATANVVLRNLDVTGVGPACSSPAGVNVVAAASVRLDGVTITGFDRAIDLGLASANPDLYVDVTINDLDAANNCTAGVRAVPTVGSKVRVALRGSSISTSHQALVVGPGAEAWVAHSSLSLNDVAVVTQGGAPAHDMCQNTLVGNATASAFTDVASECSSTATVPAPVPVPSPAPTPTPASTTPTAPAPTAVAYCTVPRLTGLPVAKARAALTKAGCSLGKVSKQRASKKSRGRVLVQAIPAKIEVRTGTRVAVKIGK